MKKNGEDKSGTEIPTVTCPKCEREWPTISEQAVVFDKVGTCYACFIHEVVAERDKRQDKAHYAIDNCPKCTGLPGAREACARCGARGWIEREGEGLIQLLQ